MLDDGEWGLPGLQRFVRDIRGRLNESGLVIIPVDPGRPPGLEDVLGRLLGGVEMVEPRQGVEPAAVLAEAFGATPTLNGLTEARLDGYVALVRLDGSAPASQAKWEVFLNRFAEKRRASIGLQLVAIDAPVGAAPNRCCMDWRGSLRRGDRLIWAEWHLPPTWYGLASELAVQQAVELCSWRLDLARDLVQVKLSDLAAPLEWLDRLGESSIPMGAAGAGVVEDCPLALLSRGDKQGLSRRIWRAQLAAIFPWLEAQRIELINAHSRNLQVDDHLKASGVKDKEEIELGSLAYQLGPKLGRKESDRVRCLARMRNALAHRASVAPEDLRMCWEIATA